MTLTTRLTVFFLAVLGCVLIGFSVGLYALASNYLYHQIDDRLTAALQTLSASVEVRRDKVEWEPQNPVISLGEDASPDQVQWLVCDNRGKEQGHSPNLTSDPLRAALRNLADGEQEVDSVTLASGEPWNLKHSIVTPPRKASKPSKLTEGKEADRAASPGDNPSEREPFDPNRPAMHLSVGTSLAPVMQTLQTLALALIGFTLGLWLLAAVAGRWLCRQALAPVREMADTARSMTAEHWETRLPSPGTGDELEELAQAFNDLLARLHESFERQRRFTGDASHQLRTPLASMIGQIDVALLRERSPEEYHRVLQVVQTQGERLRQIVEMLLFLARADGEARRPQFEPLDLSAWLIDHLQAWQAQPRGADMQCAIDEPGNYWVSTHAPLLAQLLDNLLDNAAKYSPAGTAITVRLSADEAWVSCAVEDLGAGITAEDLPHIFEPFYRSAEARRLGFAGVGLGLAVVQRIALALGGTIHAESRPGGGARFFLQLPKLREESLPTKPLVLTHDVMIL